MPVNAICRTRLKVVPYTMATVIYVDQIVDETGTDIGWQLHREISSAPTKVALYDYN